MTRARRNGPSSSMDLPHAPVRGCADFAVLCGQVDKRRNRPSLRCAPQYDLPSQTVTSESPRIDGRTRKTCDIRRVRLSVRTSSPHLWQSLKHRHSKNRATGVAFSPNPLFYRDGPTGTRTVRGTKLVVVSAGSLGTPGILERSGIGGKDVLEGVGVKQRVDLPGVGENYNGLPNDTCW
jgi:hypothetical protein